MAGTSEAAFTTPIIRKQKFNFFQRKNTAPDAPTAFFGLGNRNDENVTLAEAETSF